jgi:hypothetical protein
LYPDSFNRIERAWFADSDLLDEWMDGAEQYVMEKAGLGMNGWLARLAFQLPDGWVVCF